MFSHIMVGSNDIARSKKFYDALFVAMGGKPGVEDAKGRLIYAHNGGRLMVSKPIDGKPATHANGGTIGLSMSDAKQADAWHKAGVANGGTTIEDPPGVRQGAAGEIYHDGRFLRRGRSRSASGGPVAEHFRQREAGPESANPEEVAAGDAVAEALSATPKSEHRWNLPQEVR